MHKKMKKIVVAILALSFSACQSVSEEALKKVDEALLQGHDEVMPKSMKLAEVKEEMLKKVDSSQVDQVQKAQDIARRLDQAEAAMYQWMDTYRVIQDEVKDPAEKLKRLGAMKSTIDSIAVITDQAMTDAKNF